MVENVILLEKKLGFSSKTTRQNKKNMYTPPPPPRIFWKYTAHLLRRTPKINAQRIIDTPPLYFRLTPCI